MKTKIFTLWVALAVVVSTFAYDFQFDDLYYNITGSNTVEVTYQDMWSATNYQGLSTTTIPENVTYSGTTYSVMSIGDNAFRNCSSLTSVTIPNSVTSIGKSVFVGCSGLSSVTIPNSVTSIGSRAFDGTAWLNNQPDGAIYINQLLYKYKGKMPANTSIVVREGTTQICGSAFYDCSGLTSVTIPNSVESIGEEAFYGCSGLTSVTIPNSVTSIGRSAFSDCSGLTSVTIPNSVTSIGDYAFRHCSGLTSITIPNSVTSIGEGAFWYCSGLTSITIPHSVTSIVDGAFSDCSGLTLMAVENGNPKYDSRDNCNAIIETATNTLIAGCQSTIIPNSVTSIGGCAFAGRSGLTALIIPNSVESIGCAAFIDCVGLTTITIPNSVISIGGSAFEECRSLTKTNYTGDIAGWCSIKFDGDLSNPIASSHNLYINDVEVKELVIPNAVTSIGGWAFTDCSGLTSVTIPNSVTSIGDGAFSGSSGLTSVTIGNSITSIGNYAFYDCNQITEITCLAERAPDIADNTFTNVSATALLYVPCGSTDSYTASSYWNVFTNISETIPFNYSFTSSNEDNGTVVIIREPTCADFTIPVYAYPNTDYEFIKWSDGNKDNPREIVLTQDTTLIAEFALKQFAITTSAENGTVTGAGTYAYGTQVELKATPNAGYYFVQWNDGSKDNPRQVVVTQDSTFTAEFALQQFTVSTEAENGTVTGAGTYAYGTQVELTATPNAGYEFIKWSDGNKDNPREIVLTQDTTLIAEFALKQFAITTSAENGTVTGAGTYAYGTQVELKATPNAGYEFIKWSDGIKDNPRQVIVTQDSTFTAEFALQQFTVSTEAENGTVTGAGTYAYGTQVELTATPNAGYEFIKWSDGNKDNPRQVVVTQDSTFTAEFALKQFTVSTEAENGAVTGAGTYAYGTQVELTATPNAGYYFVQWSDGNKDNPRQVIVTQDGTFTAEFALKQFAITTSAENGAVTGAGTYAYGTQVELKATPNAGYEFIQWSDGNKDNPRQVIVTQDSTFTAEFASPQFTVSTEAENGTVIGAGTYAYGTQVELKATPNAGYYFVQWSNGNKDNPRQVVVTQDSTFTAEFALQQFTVSTEAENGTVTGAGTYAYGTQVELKATPNAGYYFVQWSDGNKDNPRQVVVTQDSTFTAEFTLKQFAITTSAENGTVTGAGTYAYGTQVELKATPNAGYYFVQWNDGNKDNPRQVTVTGNATYTAEFAVCQSAETLLQVTIEKGESYTFAGQTLTTKGTYVDSLKTVNGCDSIVTLVLNVHVTPQYTLKVLSESTGKGLVSGGGTYDAGKVVKLVADANEGFEFARWSDNNTENPRWVTVSKNQILKAYFDTLCSVEAQIVVGTAVNANAGTVAGTGYFHCGDEVQLQATANTGYAFYRWYNAELGIADTNNPVTLQVPNGTVVTAVFRKAKKTTTTTRSASAMVSVQGRMVYVQNDEPINVRIYDIIGRTLCVANHIVDYMVELKSGSYIICINDERVKIVIP